MRENKDAVTDLLPSNARENVIGQQLLTPSVYAYFQMNLRGTGFVSCLRP